MSLRMQRGSGGRADFYSCYVYDGPNGVGQEDLVLDHGG